MLKVRPTAVAGRFYPSEPGLLRQEIDGWLGQSPGTCDEHAELKALIVPHAGYRFSGAVAARAFGYLKPLKDKFSRVILVGPSHTMAFEGVAIPSVDIFASPLGNIPLDKALRDKASAHPGVALDNAPHAREHCLEVQLPFLQQTLGEFTLLPLLYSRIAADALMQLIKALWQERDTLLVISSDLSHYHPYDEAVTLDSASMGMIEAFVPRLSSHQACGATGINALLSLAGSRGWQLSRLDYKNSGDTGGDKNRVVGYVSYLVS